MIIKYRDVLLLMASTALSCTVYAADSPHQDTITVVKENATPDDVVHNIVLPKAPEQISEQNKKRAPTTSAQPSQKSATAAREQDRKLGEHASSQDRADNASSQIQETASEIHKQHTTDPHPPTQTPPPAQPSH